MKKQKMKWIIPCAAALFTIGASMTSFGAQGWTQENGQWAYYDNDGDRAADAWRKSGAHWFYLDSDGYMVTDQLVEEDDNYYYVNSDGAMVSNEWRAIPSDYDEEDAPDSYWYYLGANGKALKAPSSGKTTFKSIHKANGELKSYAFDSEGRLLFGWINDESERITGEDAWKDGVYYCGSPDDGAQVKNAWSLLEVEDDENEKDSFDGTYWFYFGSNGKKIKESAKTINGRKYRFNEYGAAESEWYQLGSDTTATPSDLYYNLPTQAWLAKGWFKTVPSEETDQEAYEEGTEYWFYANNDGKLAKDQFKTINGHRYGFNDKGEMLLGLYKLTLDSDNKVISYDEIESENDLPEADENCKVYYFGNSPKEGVMATGKTTVELDGEKYTYNFRKSGSSKGTGYNSIYDDSIYIHGRLLKADKDAKYEVVEYDGREYLIGTSGKLVKKKKNVKDGDGKYYTTNSDGTVKESGYDKLD